MEKNTVENIIKMINILQYRTLVSGTELAKRLNVSKKTIQKYKNDLEKMCIFIQTKRGKYGGYYLDKNILDFNIPITRDEFSALTMAKEYLKVNEEFMFFREYNDAVEKIEIGLKYQNNEFTDDGNYFRDSKPNINTDREIGKYAKINDAITSKNKLRFKYISLQTGETERMVQSYATFMSNGFWYVIAYCELRKEIRAFRISRMKDIELVEENYHMPKDFSLRENIENSMEVIIGSESKIKLKIEHPMSQIIRERIWWKDQKITSNDNDKSIIFEATIDYGVESIGWILGMGRYVEVIYPKKLKNRLREETEEMVKNYQQTF